VVCASFGVADDFGPMTLQIDGLHDRAGPSCRVLVRQNPWSKFDPEGLFWRELGDFAGGALVGVGEIITGHDAGRPCTSDQAAGRIVGRNAAAAVGAYMAVEGTDLHDLLGKLNIEVTKTLEEHKDPRKKRTQFDQLSRDMETLQKDFAHDTFNAVEASRVLGQLAANSQASPEIKELSTQILALLPDEAEAQRKDYAARLDALLKKVVETCLAAKKETDLDTVSAELNALKQPGYSSAPDYTQNSGRREAAIRLVRQWKEYLAFLETGYEDRAKDILRSIADSPGTFPLLTREQIMSKLGGEPKIEPLEKILSEVKDLDELAKVIADVGAVNSKRRSTDPGANETYTTLNELKQVYKAHAAAKAGLYQNALQIATNILNSLNTPASAEEFRIKTILLSEVLPAYLDLPNDATPRAGENPSQFLLRIADEAAAKGEWEKVQRVLDVYRTSAFGMRPPTWLGGEIAGCSAYLSAQKLENAGDFKRAAIEYEKVLLQPGKRLPIKEATARLAALKKVHPEAIDAASKSNETGDDATKRPAP
jgi:hypothetical protein